MTSDDSEAQWIIGEVPIHGRPVLYVLIAELPDPDVRRQLPQLVVVSWKYNGDDNNGMPPPETNSRMMELDDILSSQFEDKVDSFRAYSRTGDNLKEFTYYVASTDAFMDRLNASLRDSPWFPIEITFVHDADWSDLRDIASLFNERIAPDV